MYFRSTANTSTCETDPCAQLLEGPGTLGSYTACGSLAGSGTEAWELFRRVKCRLKEQEKDMVRQVHSLARLCPQPKE